jgi:ribosome-interacting GTPase 1
VLDVQLFKHLFALSRIGTEEGYILRDGSTVLDLCRTIHKSLAEQLKYAIVWGTSPKYSPQRVGGKHVLAHEDVIQIMKK